MRSLAALALCLALASPALAKTGKKQGPGKPTADRTEEACAKAEGDKLEACKVAGAYLDLWKKEKWADLKKLLHPKALEKAEAATKKGISTAMSPWALAKTDFLLHDWKLDTIEPGPVGTMVVKTMEDTYRVDEDGFENGEPQAYLIGKVGGKWFVSDRLSGGGTFTVDQVKVGMRGWFDGNPIHTEENKPVKDQPFSLSPEDREDAPPPSD